MLKAIFVLNGCGVEVNFKENIVLLSYSLGAGIQNICFAKPSHVQLLMVPCIHAFFESRAIFFYRCDCTHTLPKLYRHLLRKMG